MRNQLSDPYVESRISNNGKRFPLSPEPRGTNVFKVTTMVVAGIALYMMIGTAIAVEPKARVFFERQDSVKIYFDVELANTFARRSEGLMWRNSVPARNGMLFDFEKSSRIRMWMKNTRISLDMIFLDDERKIVYIHEAAEPLSLDIIQSPSDAQFTVEINAGEARRYNLSAGDRLHIR